MFKQGAKLVFVFVASLIANCSAIAQTLQASVNTTQVAKNEVINLRIIADTEQSSDAINFDVLEKDFFLGQPRYGRSSNSINGQKSVRTEWSISIAPIREGDVTIPSFSIDGMKTRPIMLRVSANKAEPELDDLFQFNLNLSNKVLYPKQSATLKIQLLINVDPRRLDNPVIVPPSVNGMHIEAASDMRQGKRIIDGLEVNVVEQDFQLTAEQPGTFELNGPRLTGSYIYSDRQTGSTKIMPINTKAEQIPITVKQIPSSFEGNWLPASALEMTQTWQDEQGNYLSNTSVNNIKQGSSITRTIRIRARGTQSEYLPRVNISYPDSLRVYPEQPQFDTAPDGTLTMVVKQVLIPTKAGELALPGYNVKWWNSQRDQARQSNLTGLKLNVEKSDSGLLTLPDLNPNLQAAPTVATNTSQIGVDPIWRTLTIIFALLWLLSSATAFALWKNKGVRPSHSKNSKSDGSAQSLEQIIKQGDCAKIEQAVNQHLKHYVNHAEPDALEAIKEELKMMNQAHFGTNKVDWTSDSLLNKLKKLSKPQQSTSTTSLEKL
ncbi:hypothetical protein BS333_19330 [Vibrio azureus]|uniref:BatD protein n=1 Tax=Vibrio azureus NBRC 104587 TaxID=1219077 RepID=U3AAV1_9VIBR|nr:BatD family protein [Vibrio azureus]AUI88478.1 hypothetical protein BS333_19330 [Vibrio azureus]GAD77076.1 hypothetical protein VAZ01S_060_00260 [Vibrio azureus NBRC 104587]